MDDTKDKGKLDASAPNPEIAAPADNPEVVKPFVTTSGQADDPTELAVPLEDKVPAAAKKARQGDTVIWAHGISGHPYTALVHADDHRGGRLGLIAFVVPPGAVGVQIEHIGNCPYDATGETPGSWRFPSDVK